MEDYWKYHTLTDTIFAALTSACSVREFHRTLYRQGKKRYKRSTIDSTVSRMKKKGYISKVEGNLFLTPLGKEKQAKERVFDLIPSPFKGTEKPDSIVAFDIPERERAKRNWLRNQLKVFGYTMLQQSLWLGPGPLPKEFKDRLRKLQISAQVKIFAIQK